MKPMSGCALIGAARALSGIQDGVVLQHSVVGCHWGSLAAGMLQQPDDFRQASTVVYEENVIQGGTELIPQGLDNITQLYPDAKVIFVISGCIPNMIGDDTESAVDHWQEEHPEHTVLYIPAPGYAGNENDGIERALLALLPLMAGHETAENEIKRETGSAADQNFVSKKLPTVNILGIMASDPYSINDLQYLRRLFAGKLEILCASHQCTTKEISRMGQADMNIVFGRGEKLAKIMWEQFGIPYLCCEYPYGIQGMRMFLQKLEECLSVDFSEEIRKMEKEADRVVRYSGMYLTTLYLLPAIVTGDRAHRPGMKRFLQDELGMDVTAEFDTDAGDQNQLEKELQHSDAVLLLGSSFEAELAERFSLPLVRYVYPVVDEVCLTRQTLLGAEGTAYLIQQIVNAVMRVRYKAEGIFRALRD